MSEQVSRIAAHRRHIEQLRADRDRSGEVEPWAYENLIRLAQAESEVLIERRLDELEWLLNEGPMDRRKRRSLELERAELEALLTRDRQLRAEEDQTRQAAEERRQRQSAVGRVLGYLLVPVMVLVKVVKLKVFGTLLSMLVSVGAYALIWGWKFAAGFVLLLLVHEYGHVLQLRREGVPAGAPMFIPFVGAFVAMKQMPANAAAEARVGLAGPVLGSAACLVPLAFWQATGGDFWQALTFTVLVG